MKYVSRLIAVAGVAILPHVSFAATLWQTNFDAESVNTYTANATIGTGDSSAELRPSAASPIGVVDLGSGNHAMQFTDNSTDTGIPHARKFYNGVSTTDSGDNFITGSFTYKRLLNVTSSSTSPTFVFHIGSAVTGGSSVTAVHIEVASDGTVMFRNGTSAESSGFALTTGQEYRFDLSVDLSSNTQDKWWFTVTDLSDNLVKYTSAVLNTRAPNIIPTWASLLAAVNGTAQNASPFAQVDNISLVSQPVPEPAAIGGFLTAALVWSTRRSR